MLTTGNQLKAARALVGMTQVELAKASGVDAQTIHRMESRRAEKLTSGLDTILKITRALEKKGVEFTNHGKAGVRLR